MDFDGPAGRGTAIRLLAPPIPDGDCEAMGDWVLLAASVTADPENFLPAAGAQDLEAKRLCARCPVRRDCLEYSLGTGPYRGVQGGLTEAERKSLNGKHRPQQASARKGVLAGGAS